MDSAYPTGRRRTVHRRELVLIAICTLLGACGDSTEPTRAITRGQAASFEASPSSLHASAISFDFSAEVTHAGTSRTMQAHVDRVAGVSGWRTTITLIDDPRVVRLPAATWRPRRLVIDESGRLTVYRVDGQVAGLPDVGRVPRPPGTTSPARTTRADGIMVGTDWIDDLILASGGRASASARMTAGATATGRDMQGLDHYVKTVGSVRRDFAVDPASGIVRGVVLSDGVRTSRAAFEYVNTQSGLSVRTRSHIEQAGGKFAGSHTITIQKVVVDGNEVTP